MAKHERIKKNFGLQPMISGRSFPVGAVGQNLLVHLGQQFAQTKLAPLTRGCQLRKHHAQPKQARDVTQVMIAGGDVRELQIALNVRTVLIEHLQEILQREFIETRRAQKKGERRK